MLGNTAYGVFQDRENYIWVGTTKGVSRFDGTVFERDFMWDDRLPNSVDRIFSYNDSTKLLTGTNGPSCWVNGQWDYQAGVSDFSILQGVRVSQSAADSSLTYWSKSKLLLLEPSGTKLKYTLTNYPANQYTCVHNYSRDSLFVATTNAAFILFRGKSIPLPELHAATCILQLGDSSLVFARNKIFSLKGQEVRLLHQLDENHSLVQYAVQDHKANVWFAGKNHRLHLLQNGQIISMSESLGLQGGQVTYLHVDRSGNVWISTNALGLICVLDGPFTNYSMMDGLLSNEINCLKEWRGALYVGTNAGLHRLDETEIIGPEGVVKQLGLSDALISPLEGYILQITSGPKRLHVSSNQYKSITSSLDTGALVTNSHSSMAVFSDTLFCAQWGSWYSRICSEKSLWNFHRKKAFGMERAFRKEYVVHKRRNNRQILVGTSDGLFETNADLNEVKPIVPDFPNEHLTYFDILETDEGVFWMGTSNGLICWNGADEWKRFTTAEGLVSNQVRTLEMDHLGRLWLGTDQGINLFDGGVQRTFTVGSGLLSNRINDLHYSAQRNVLWIGSNLGLSSINLDQVAQVGERSFPLKIKSVEVVGDQRYDPSRLPEFSWEQNNIRIQFTSINYRNPSEVTYQYRLLPVDSTWRSTTINQVEFIGLVPSEYRLEVRSKTVGFSQGNAVAQTFTIAPPFWQTAWFYSLSLLVLLVLASGVFRYFLLQERRRSERKNAFLQKINQLEQQALSLSMNPHFIFNSLNSIQDYYSHIKNREANEFIARFAQLVRMNMDSAHQGSIRVSDEVERLKLYLSLEKVRFPHAFGYTVTASSELLADDPSLPSMVIQPLVENAIWHGVLPAKRSGRISIRFWYDEALYIEVLDNGVGFKAASRQRQRAHQSKGLYIARERLRFLSEANYIRIRERVNEAGEVFGTRVEVRIEA